MKRTLAVLFVVLLVLVSGCVHTNYNMKQYFNENGDSIFTLNSKTTIDKRTSDALPANGMNKWVISVRAFEDYMSSREYAETLCNSADKNKIKSCKINEDNSVEIIAELKPGKFYEYEEEFDRINLRKIMKFKIKKIPLITYYENELDTAMNKDLQNYFMAHSLNYIKKDFFCEPGLLSILNSRCNAFQKGNKNIFEINWTLNNSRFPVKKLVGYYCKNNNEIYSDNKDIIPITVPIEGKTVNLSCPQGEDNLILLYEIEANGEVINHSTTFTMKTKEQIRDEILESFSESKNYISTPKLEDKELPYHYWDFENASFMGNDYNSIQKSAYGEAPMFKAEYTPKFDGKIISARIGSKELKTNENSFTLRLSEMGNYPDSAIEVVVVKEVSPLGVYTWLLIIIVIIAGIYLIFMRKNK